MGCPFSTPVDAADEADDSPVGFYQVTTFGVLGDQQEALAKAKDINEREDMVEGLACSRVCCSKGQGTFMQVDCWNQAGAKTALKSPLFANASGMDSVGGNVVHSEGTVRACNTASRCLPGFDRCGLVCRRLKGAVSSICT